MSQTLLPPQPLVAEHRLEDFSCWEPSLDEWLRRRALVNQATGASRTFVVANESGQVLAYYALAAGAVSHQESPGSIRRNMPDPIPVIVLGRLAVHVDMVGQGIGQGLLKDAVQRTLQISEQVGARALVCHAIDDAAKAFYLKHGFIESPIHNMTVMLPLR